MSCLLTTPIPIGRIAAPLRCGLASTRMISACARVTAPFLLLLGRIGGVQGVPFFLAFLDSLLTFVLGFFICGLFPLFFLSFSGGGVHRGFPAGGAVGRWSASETTAEETETD